MGGQLEMFGRYRTEQQRIVCEAIGAVPSPTNSQGYGTVWAAVLPRKHKLGGHNLSVLGNGVIEHADELLNGRLMAAYRAAHVEIGRRRLNYAEG